MQLPNSDKRDEFNKQIKVVEANLKDATSGEKDQKLLEMVQKRIDTLAKKYQYDDDLGAERYKLYEIQALVHYFNGHDDDALDFIDQAIELYGKPYPKAERLKQKLAPGDMYIQKTIDPKKMTKEQRRKNLIGLEGWLALFTVGVIVSTILFFISTGVWLQNFNLVDIFFEEYAASLVSPYYAFFTASSFIAGVMSLWLLTLLIRRKKIARGVGIVYLQLLIIVAIIEYGWYSNLKMEVPSLDQQQDFLVNGWSIVWIIYLIVSRRVKNTLTR